MKEVPEIESKESELPILICPNCGFETRSVFEFREHFEDDKTGYCEDVHYG